MGATLQRSADRLLLPDLTDCCCRQSVLLARQRQLASQFQPPLSCTVFFNGLVVDGEFAFPSVLSPANMSNRFGIELSVNVLGSVDISTQ